MRRTKSMAWRFSSLRCASSRLFSLIHPLQCAPCPWSCFKEMPSRSSQESRSHGHGPPAPVVHSCVAWRTRRALSSLTNELLSRARANAESRGATSSSAASKWDPCRKSTLRTSCRSSWMPLDTFTRMASLTATSSPKTCWLSARTSHRPTTGPLKSLILAFLSRESP